MADNTTPYPPSSQAWWMVAVFCIAGFVSYVHRLILSVLVVPLQHDLVIGDSKLSLLQGAAFAIVYVFAGLPLGWLADRRQRRNLVVLGSIVWSIGTLACGFAPGFAALFVARVLVGIGEAALAPAAASMIGDAFPPERRGTALGVFLMGMAVGGPASVGIGGGLLAAAQAGAFHAWPIIGDLAPWRVVLTLVGACGLVIPFLALSVREPPRRESVGVVPFAQVASHLTKHRMLLITLLIAIALLSVGDYGLFSWTPTALERRFGWSPDKIGAYFTAITTVAGIGGAVLGGVLSDVAAARGGERARYAVSLVAAALAAFAAAQIAGPTPTQVLAGLGLWTFASTVGAINGIAILQQFMPNEMRGVSMSLVAFCNTLLGLGCGPTVVALVTEYGYRSPLAVGLSVATVVVPAALISLLLFVTSRRAATDRVRAA